MADWSNVEEYVHFSFYEFPDLPAVLRVAASVALMGDDRRVQPPLGRQGHPVPRRDGADPEDLRFRSRSAGAGEPKSRSGRSDERDANMRGHKFNTIHLRYEDKRGGRIMHDMTQSCLIEALPAVRILCQCDGLEFGSGNATRMAAT